VLWSLAGLPLPAPLAHTLDILGRAALCLGLICVGSGLVFSRCRACAAGAGPDVGAEAAGHARAGGPGLPAVRPAAGGQPGGLLYCALPTAPNAYIMARQMGGDTRLMATLITVQTLLSALTVPLSRDWLRWLA
jgi:predicted permease